MISLNDFEEKWDNVKKCDDDSLVQRVDSVHPVDFYFGYDTYGKRIFLVITSIHPSISIASDSILLEIRVRKDERYATFLTLEDKDLEDVFIRLCWDLFNFTQHSSCEEEGINLLQVRFKIWQRMLKRSTAGLLSKTLSAGSSVLA